jgi:uncharacterized protein YndB with AHSA1/START domain
MTDIAAQPTTLVLRRVLQAPPERVYEAWTTPEHLRAFFCPESFTATDVTADARVGGAYRITMMSAEGEAYVAHGTYRELVKPERIVCTWSWEEDDPALEIETLLTLELRARGRDTELVLTHERFRDAAQRDRHGEGWTSILAKLERMFATAPEQPR